MKYFYEHQGQIQDDLIGSSKLLRGFKLIQLPEVNEQKSLSKQYRAS